MPTKLPKKKFSICLKIYAPDEFLSVVALSPCIAFCGVLSAD